MAQRLFISIIFIAWSIVTAVMAHAGGTGVAVMPANKLLGGSLTTTAAYDFKTKATGEAIELTGYGLVFNTSLLYRHWNADLFDSNNDRYQNELRLYLGLGLAYFVQIQGSLAPDKSSTLRIKFEDTVSHLFGGNNRETDPTKNIIIGSYIESDFRQLTLIGFSVGYLFY